MIGWGTKELWGWGFPSLDFQACFKGRQGFILFEGGSQGIPCLSGSAEFPNVCFESVWYQIVVHTPSCVEAVGDTD